MSFAALLADVIPRLDRAGVPYMVTGSLASSYYGEPRSTRDLDIVIDPDAASLERLVDELVEGRFYVDRDAALEALHDRSQFNAMDADATKIDFVIRRIVRSRSRSSARRERADLLGTPAFVATAEDVVLSKLEWAVETDSDRQLSDAAAILAIDDGLDLAYIDRWAAVLGVIDVGVRSSDTDRDVSIGASSRGGGDLRGTLTGAARGPAYALTSGLYLIR